ncbi:nitroreductase family protein [Delftia lacustris]
MTSSELSSMPVGQAIASRISADRFEPGSPLADETLAALVAQASLSPSAYNLQNWRFIAVRTPEAKARLKAAAYGQQKVEDASAVFIVCGTLAAHARLAEFLQPSVDSGVMSQRTADGWVAQAHAAHADNLQLQRDEAVRSASLAAMTLMLSAQGLGLASCPMVGFDAQALAAGFGLQAHELPVMLVAVGHAAGTPRPQKARRPLADILAYA